ncbi:MAG: polymerase subunit beta protein [Parcubacteria group bacterium GW2011_GWD2_43_10]|uniref:HTH arsR-type domain-containing protein n=2 Tax=Candidatus Vebleniibacteriota TaxID=1817921 RepID=A0A1G2Q6H8_9BACT|nr:MAG: polymerase subunit beta protein [Parcubacteria group bacterium GW2011_GWA2_42_80]KKS78887.1 MAG: polymerase subunit beta protein [Parcubacteria group bacterium GW2011_GWD1_42_9]KKS83059.1 MAG: polymerase subunit beta protein [Parcubacteria group bacterium GW2011_GWD2_43_10]KKS93744.1 MAG: polymerase subunit beta protein [Parcubacteria group bacterium GW2011_GWE2_43_12]KKT14338.1 MAG: polymerase subunit beta protein [Parcubacteria group bacterium GW2011_GWA1_43_27]KKT16138.1 MAG: polyme
MLEQLFGSRTRVKLLRLFLTNPTTPFYVREISRKVDEQLNSVRRELANLASLGIVEATAEQDKKYYQLNTGFVLAAELKAVILKSQLLMEQDLIKKIRESGKVKYLALTGIFTNAKQPLTDILVVGKVDRSVLVRAIERFQREVGKEVNYTLLSLREYNERRGLGDKFLLGILNSPQMVVVDELNEP